MDLKRIAENILSEEIDNIISEEVGEGAAEWKNENILLLREYALNKLLKTNKNNPLFDSNFLESVSSEKQKEIQQAYKIVNEKFPLTEGKAPKERARERIFNEIGEYDIYEIVADLSKRICMLERFGMRLGQAMMENNTLPENIKEMYGAFLQAYVTGVEAREIRDRTDLENNWEVFNRLMFRMNKVADIIKEEMYIEEGIEPEPFSSGGGE